MTWFPVSILDSSNNYKAAWAIVWSPDIKITKTNKHGIDSYGVDYCHYFKDSNGAIYDRYRYYLNGKQIYHDYLGPTYLVHILSTGERLILCGKEFNSRVQQQSKAID
jgi:hypothetical protein